MAAASALQIERVPCLSDNYAWLLHEPTSQCTAVVDPSEAGPVRAALARSGYTLTHILNTHHHWDHTGGNAELKAEFNCTVVGPAADRDRIPGIDVALAGGDTYSVGAASFTCFDTPGHTRGHITLYCPSAAALFPGDTLFSLGCGRLFEGTPAQMWASLSKLVPLPAETRVYCAHEYTQSNARWVLFPGEDKRCFAWGCGRLFVCCHAGPDVGLPPSPRYAPPAPPAPSLRRQVCAARGPRQRGAAAAQRRD